MIKVNLIPQPKKFKIPVVMGLDIKMFNFKLLFVAYLFTLIPSYVQEYYFDKEIQKVDAVIQETNKIIRSLNKSLNKNKNIRKMLGAFDKQIKSLRSKEAQVSAIIKKRTNPMKVLLHFSRSIPEDTWFETIDVRGKVFKGTGGSISYKSIGDFIDGLNDSIFFNKSVRLKKTETQKIKKDEITEIRVEKFEISGTIERFE